MYVGKYILDSLADLELIQRRQVALRSLVSRRNKRLNESLERRITRAKDEGVDPGLTREEWVRLHNDELANVRGQLADLELEMIHAREQGADLKRAMARAKRQKASQPQKL